MLEQEDFAPRPGAKPLFKAIDLPSPLQLDAVNMAVEVDRFLSRFDDYLDGLFVRDDQTIGERAKLAHFKRAMGEHALMRFEMTIQKDDRDTYDNAVDEFKVLFGKPLPTTLAFAEFTSRRQRSSENLDGFMHELQVLAKPCEEVSLEHMTVARFIAGVRDQDLREYLLEKTPTTVKEVMELAHNFEANRQGCDRLRNDHGTTESDLHDIRRGSHCYACGATNCPRGVGCRAHNRKCFTCQQRDHLSAQCTEWTAWKNSRRSGISTRDLRHNRPDCPKYGQRVRQALHEMQAELKSAYAAQAADDS